MTTINICPQDPAPAAPSRGSASTLNLALGYGRVSTAKQGLSREAQTETVQRAAAFHVGGPDSGPDAVSSEMFFDDDTSGSIPFVDRPAGRQLLARVRDALAAGQNPTVIVTKVDRLGRDTVDVSQTVTLFESLGARIVFLDINVDTRTAMGRAFMQIAAVFAELERARIRERIQTTLDLKRSQNLVIGTVPYGWDARDTGARNKTGKPVRELVANPAEQQNIVAMARARAAGASYNQIARDLNRRGADTRMHHQPLLPVRLLGIHRHELLAQQPVIVKAQLEMNDVPNESVQPIPPPRLLENRRGRRPHHVIAGKRPHRRLLQRHAPPIVQGKGGRVQLPRRTQILGRGATRWCQPITAFASRFHSKCHSTMPPCQTGGTS